MIKHNYKGGEIDDKKDIIDKLINNLYIHNSKLSKLYGEQYVKKLKKD